MSDWAAQTWRAYRAFGEPILTGPLSDPGNDEHLVAAAELVALIRRRGGHVEANGEVAWPPQVEPWVDEDAERWTRIWPLARELLAFERWLDQDLAALAR